MVLHNISSKKAITLVALAIGASATVMLTGVTHLSAQTSPTSVQAPSRVVQTTPTVTPASKLSPVDQLFIIDAAHGGMAEVRMAELALKQSSDNAVKQYAQQMIKEHTALNNQLTQVARSKGVTPPTDLGKYQILINQISQLSGPAFDQMYRNEAGVNSHMESLAVFRRQAMAGQDPDLKRLAAGAVPDIQKHLDMGMQMAGVTLNSGQRMTSGSTMSR